MLKQIICFGLLIGLLTLVGCQTVEKYDEVIYDCGDTLYIGTEISKRINTTSEWDLENEVEVYYLQENNWTKKYNYSIREWVGIADAVGLNSQCKEILRFSNYTEIAK